MLTKQQKIKLVDELGEIIKNNPNILFVDFTGLKMGELSDLKRELKKEGIGFRVLKKSLLDFAFKKSGRESFDVSSHKSSVAIVYGSTPSAQLGTGSLTTGGSTPSAQLGTGSLTTGGSAEPNPDKSCVSNGASVIAKIIYSFSVKSKKLEILGGFLIGEKMMKDKVVMLAQIPSREVLLSQFLQTLLYPVSGFARVLDGMAKKGN